MTATPEAARSCVARVELYVRPNLGNLEGQLCRPPEEEEW